MPENYFSNKLGNKLRRHNASNKCIQHIHTTVSLCNLPSMSHQILQGKRRAKPFFEFTCLLSSFICCEKIGPYLIENFFAMDSWDHLQGTVPPTMLSGLHEYQQTAFATSEAHTKALLCFLVQTQTFYALSHCIPNEGDKLLHNMDHNNKNISICFQSFLYYVLS